MSWELGREVKHTSKVIYVVLEDKSKAYLKYQVEGKVMKLVETYTPPQHRGKGIGNVLVNYAIDLAKSNEWLIEPICSYTIYYFMRNKDKRFVLVEEYRDLSEEKWVSLFESAKRREAEQRREQS
ncbi:MAG: GNAT family N-acetyltransferase [Desulfurococcaceae archaeon]